MALFFMGLGYDREGRSQSFSSLFGDQITVERFSDIEEQFPYNISTKTLKATLANGGTATVEDDMLKLASSVAVDGSATLESKNIIQHRSGFEEYAFFTVLFESNPIGAIQRIGPFTIQDGYYMGYGTDGIFEIGRINGGVVTAVKENDFNGDNRWSQIDKTKLNVFGIHYGWLGASAIFYSVMLPNGQWIDFHVEKITGTLAIPHSSNPQVPICGMVTKTSGATDVIIRCGSWNGGVNGVPTGAGSRYFPATQDRAALSTEALVMNLRVVPTFQSKTNRVTVELIKQLLTSDGTKIVKFRIYRNLVVATPTWVNIDAVNSVVQKDILGTPTFDVAKLEDIQTLGKIDAVPIPMKDQGFVYFPGDIITISAESANASDVSSSVRWRENF